MEKKLRISFMSNVKKVGWKLKNGESKMDSIGKDICSKIFMELMITEHCINLNESFFLLNLKPFLIVLLSSD